MDHHKHEHIPRPDRNDPTSKEPENLAEQLVSPELRGRESNCSHGCGSGDGSSCGACGTGSCATGGCGSTSLVQLIASKFEYNDTRRIVEIEFKGSRRDFVHIADETVHVRIHDLVIVQNDKGVDSGRVVMTGSLVHAKRKAKGLSDEELPVLLRVANTQDAERHDRNRESEHNAIEVCRARVAALNLNMHVADAEWQFDHRRITFYFTADGRIDFRELVKDLASIFHTRIELRQIPTRDVAKRFGGLGICGKELCCSTHLGRYEHITLDHAKIQNLQINPTKLSGQCGRLKCCLLYEIDAYVEGMKRFPPLESELRTSKGMGIIQKIDVFRDLVYLFHPSDLSFEMLTLEELNVVISAVPAS